MNPSSMKIADLTSSTGALILGVGLGALYSEALAKNAFAILAIGALCHGWGMYDKHKQEKLGNVTQTWWSKGFYWLCWILLALLPILLFI